MDDSLDCLWSTMQDAHGNARPWITGGNGKHDRMRGEEELKAHFDRVVNNAYARDAEAQMQFCRPAQTWETVVAHLGLKPPIGAWLGGGSGHEGCFGLRFIQVFVGGLLRPLCK